MKLTSSRFASAIGVSPWQSRQKLFRIMSGIENPDPLNANMQWGIDHECDAVAAVEAHTGIFFDNTGSRQCHYLLSADGYDLGTTPDGRSGSTGLEVKCPQKAYDEPPAHYVPQLIGQARIAALQDIYFSCWTPQESRIWLYKYDPEHWNWMSPLLDKFMGEYAAGEEPKRTKKPKLPEITMERIL